MTDTLHSRLVRRACALVGTQRLADRLETSRGTVESWLAGAAAPPPRAFLKIMRLIRAADPAFRVEGG
jgi:DNA-binding transcriptional regulator YiaG